MLKFLRNNFRWIVGGFVLTFFSGFGQTYFISGSIAEWQSNFDLSHGEIGRIYMFATLGSAACLPFLGRLVDSISAHGMIVLVVPVLALASLMAGYASSVPMLVAAIFLLRLFGQGMMTHMALTATGRWFAVERGRAVSLVVLGHQGGEAILPLAFSTIALVYGYQAGWTAGAVLLLLVGLPISYWAYRQPREPHGNHSDVDYSPRHERSWTRREVMRDPVFWILLTGVLAPGFIGTTIFYHQNYMTALYNWPSQLFAQSLVVMALTTVVCALVTGAIIDRVGANRLLPILLLPLSVACFTMAISGPAWSLFLIMVLIGVSYGISSTLFGALWPENYGILHLGSIRSVTVSATVFATAAGPGLTGTLIDSGIALPTQMKFMGAYCLVTTGVMTFAAIVLRRRAALADGPASES